MINRHRAHFPDPNCTDCGAPLSGGQCPKALKLSYFEKRFNKFRETRAGGLVDTKLMARLESVAEELNQTLCIDGGPGPALKHLENELKKGWDTFLGTLEDIHNRI